ncbi:acetyltransferase [Fictibacillus sp. KU28468]|uniref:acetyltransferase n=1 Tax=Fictibacillus sp. KU28468 TaxID=2991053 RepID=UPI00223DFC89|nr:acetyltransferase [Fictibacillus sp. KU28468]UZJ79547.1 acetyltransferase [Fictibacillus sp. KU28468]
MKKLVVIGDGGHSKVVRDIVLAGNEYEWVGTLDDKYASFIEKDGRFSGPIHTVDRILERFGSQVYFVIAIGSNRIRKAVAEQLEIYDVKYAVLVHPSAIIGSNVNFMPGTVVMPGAIVNSSASIHTHCIINTNAVVEHDCILYSYVHLSPGAILAGNVTVLEGASIGIGAKMIPSVSAGEWSTVGAGAVVIKDIPPCCTAIGVPASPMKHIKSL